MESKWVCVVEIGKSEAVFTIKSDGLRYVLFYENAAASQDVSLLNFYKTPEKAVEALVSGASFASVMLYVGDDGLTLPTIKDTSTLDLPADLEEWQFVG